MRRQSPSPPTERVLRILEALACAPPQGVSLTGLLSGLSISYATGHAIVGALVENGWATRSPDTAHLSLGPRAAEVVGGRAGRHSAFDGCLDQLHARLERPVFVLRLVRRQLVITHSRGHRVEMPQVGFRAPYAAPFGRDFAAWDTGESLAQWFSSVPDDEAFASRMDRVLPAIRDRRFSVENFSEIHEQVIAAFSALRSADVPSAGELIDVDPITSRLATAVADLTTVDLDDDELRSAASHRVATVSVAIPAPDRGLPTASLHALCVSSMTPDEITQVADELDRTAQAITELSEPLPWDVPGPSTVAV
ncbi:hypothetical protein [uncultured Williamsia sp.]|uniref:hypothetical protein n=1 Tax=uncultured Williamsia sp. TaxID=259311 RepID=UPI002631969D|nr:hypothetical protein [uncultured Williamsia sp.]